MKTKSILDACKVHVANKRYLQVNSLFQEHKNDVSFSARERDLLFFYNSVSAFYIGNPLEGYACCRTIILNGILDKTTLFTALNNLKFYKKQISEDADLLALFLAVDSLIQKNYRLFDFHQNHFNVWTMLYTELEPFFTKYKHFSHKNKASPSILLSVTSCKRFDLFQKTINSVLNAWDDVDLVDYWFCVDDNSSAEDRAEMVSKYSWFDFYMKDESEKGHLSSMNIIWDKLNELKPKYWVHLEDDYVFYHKLPYVSRGIKGLTLLRDKNVYQVLFNRGYAETVEYLATVFKEEIVDGVDGFFVNVHNSTICWPHYSFRPSIVLTEKILELGKFEAEQTFFEVDYAAKWMGKGYKTAFFDSINSRHIGKLTYSKNKNELNAYKLNDVEQGVPFFRRE